MAREKQKSVPPGLSRLRSSVAASVAGADFTGAAQPTLTLVQAPPEESTQVVDEPATAAETVVAPPEEVTAQVASESDEGLDQTVPVADDATAQTAAVTAPHQQRATAPRLRRPSAKSLTPHEARTAVVESYLSARQHPEQWVNAGVRLPREVRDRIEERLERDQDRTGNYQLAMAHYVNAALDLIPDDDLDTVVSWANSYLTALGMQTPVTVGTGTRMHGDVDRRMKRLPARMRRHSRYGLAGHLHAAAVVRLLDALDQEDTETPPEPV